MAPDKQFGFRNVHTNRSLYSKILLLAASLSILWSVYFAVVTISIPYQIEFREGAAQVMTEFLLNRSNPFTFENQPLAMNNYGMGYNLMVLPFAWLFGNTLLVHRSVTFAFIILSALLGFLVIVKRREDSHLAAVCAAFVMLGLIARGGIGAFPSAMGTFLFLMTITVPFLKGFNLASLIWSVLFSIAAFYSKAYFMLGFAIVVSYLFLFVSRRTALLYGMLFLSFLATSLFVVRLVFPLYLIDTLVGNLANTERSFVHLLSQLKQLLIYFFPILISSILLALDHERSNQSGDFRMDIRSWKQPLFSLPLDYFLYSTLCALLAFLVILGPHIGNYLSYAYQLVLPVFFCWFFLKFDLQAKKGFWITAAVVFNLCFWGLNELSPHRLAQKDSKEWSLLYSQIRSSSNILNSPVVTSMVMDLGLNPLDSGQTSYSYAVQPYPDDAILGPSYDEFRTDGFKYVRFIDSSIEKQKFDLIVTTREKSTFYHAKLLEQFYMPVANIKVDMPQTNQQWTVVLWKPR